MHKKTTTLIDGRTLSITLIRETLKFSNEEHDLPPVTNFGVDLIISPEVQGEKAGAWSESFGSKSELKAFMKGLRAAAALIGAAHLRLPNLDS